MSQPQTKREIFQGGLHTAEVLNVLSLKLGASSAVSLPALKGKAVEILEQSVDPIAQVPDKPSDGLVYGLVQSGKTSVIQVAAAMAADNKFKCILVLTSYIDILYGQTFKRMKSALQGLEVLGKTDWKDSVQFENKLRSSPTTLVIVCPKNDKRMGGLLDALKKSRARGISALIIDDEADLASLDTHTADGEEPSTINRNITELRSFFQVNTYLQVTATPQALFLQSPEHRYRPSFTVLTEPGPGYVGGDQFFGDPEEKLLEMVDINEVEMLVASKQPNPTQTIPIGLKRALLTFFVAASDRKIKNPTRHFAFLCHVSAGNKDHTHIVNLIGDFKTKILYTLREPDTQKYSKLLKELEDEYRLLQKTQVSLAPFPEIVDKIKFFLHGASIKLVNTQSSDEIELDSMFSIFVGGNKLGRGVTIDSLLVSYYGRNPKKPNIDTVLQHARMYGYRQDDIGVTRLFLPRKLADQFASIHDTDNALREVLRKYPKGNFEVLWVANPMQATRRNVLNPDALAAYVAGESINPRYPLRVEVSLLTATIDEKFKNIGDYEDGIETTIDDLYSILEMCPTDPAFGGRLWNLKTIKAALDTLKKLIGNKAYIVIRRNRKAETDRGERKGIISDSSVKESQLAPSDAPTLFLYRQDAMKKGEEPVWWPQLRFPEGEKGNYVLSFSIDEKEN